MKRLLLVFILFATTAAGQVPIPPELEEFCSKTQRVKFTSVIHDERICAQYGKPAPCQKRCGWMIFEDNCTHVRWKGCKPIENLFDTSPTPIPTRTPFHIPTKTPFRTTGVTPNPFSTPTSVITPQATISYSNCANNNPAYCWAIGARLNDNGSCFSGCVCIPRGDSSGCKN